MTWVLRSISLFFACALWEADCLFVSNTPHKVLVSSQLFLSQSANAPLADDSAFNVRVSYEGISRDIPVFADESILSAMERLNIAQEVGLPDVPYDCRRGCCLSCSAQHVGDSISSNLNVVEDGLNPLLTENLSRDGYVLTCSSYVKGNGVHLLLGQNNEVWKSMYQTRLLSEELQHTGREAVARTIREHAERHVGRWIQETEYALHKDDSDIDLE
jgi:hypothetical protein